MSLTEDDVRRIIREELKAFLISFAATANNEDGYDTRELESVALQAILKVSEKEAEDLPHAWSCDIRKRYDDWGNDLGCSCGLV